MLEKETDELKNGEDQTASEQSGGIPDVFISYSSLNKEIADAVVEEYEAHGIRCWYAPRNIMPGQEWVTAIHDAIDGAKLFVLIYTEQSNASRQVANEVALAFNSGKMIIPYRLSEVEMSTELEYYLTRVHWLNAVSEPLDKSVKNLREYSEKILSGDIPKEAQDHNVTRLDKKNEKNGLFGISYERILIAVLFMILFIILFILVLKDLGEKKQDPGRTEPAGQTQVVESTSGTVMDEEAAEFYVSGYQYQMQEDLEDHFELAYEEYMKTGDTITSDQKIVEALYYLGKRYNDADGVEYDYQKAMALFEKASACGDTNSMNMLGNMYLRGDGVDVDYDMAEKYYRMAVDLGDETGKKNLDYLNSIRTDKD